MAIPFLNRKNKEKNQEKKRIEIKMKKEEKVGIIQKESSIFQILGF